MMLDKKKKGAPKACCRAMADIYDPVRVLGHGSQGIVFLCKHKASGALVACKTSLSHYHLHPACKAESHKGSFKSKLALLLSTRKKSPISAAPAQEDGNAHEGHDEELRCEIEVMQRAAGHPNILPVLSTFESDDGFVHLITPFCEDGSLVDKLLHDHKTASQSPKPLLDDRRAAKVIASLAGALSYLHSCDVVHRDVKLDNIFVHRRKGKDVHGDDEEDIVLLGDFGSAAALSPNQKMSLFVGTKMYMAPEVKQHAYDHRVDIWSLGIVLHVLLSGAFLTDDLKLHASIYDYQACDLLLGMLCVDPTKRFTLEQILSHPWIVKNTSKLLSSESHLATTTTSIKPTIKSCKQVLAAIGHARPHSSSRVS